MIHAVVRVITVTVLLAVPSTSAHQFSIAAIEIEHPFLRATPPNASTGAGYMIIRNKGGEPDRLIGIETEAAGRVEFHRSVIENGVAKMVPIEGGIEIPAGGEFGLGFDGSHAMLVDLTAPIGLGQIIMGTLIFEKAGRLEMDFEVEPIGATLEGELETHERAH